eukprot:UN34173
MTPSTSEDSHNDYVNKITKVQSIPNVVKAMKHFRTWKFNIFSIYNELKDYTMPYLGLRVFHELSIGEELDLSEHVFVNMLMDFVRKYRPPEEVIYHNALHAADVMCTHYYFIKSKIFERVPLLDIFASIVACCAHDIDHNGYNNLYHITTGSELAILYNDRSVLENHHSTTGWRLLKKHDLLRNLSQSDRETFRHVFTSCILGTDMAQHSEHLVELTEIIKQVKIHDKKSEITRLSPNMLDKKELSLDRYFENVLSLSCHSSDISNVSKEFQVCNKWVNYLMEEFWKQGDTEKEKRTTNICTV